MDTSGSTTYFRRLPSVEPPALAQFHPEPGLAAGRDVQRPYTDEPLLAKQGESGHATSPDVSFGPFRLLTPQFLLLDGDKPVRLGSRALQLLIVLLQCPGELVSKQELMDRVWPNVFVEPANVTVHMSALRRALRDGQDGNRFIINIPGRGYSFVGPVAIGWVDPAGDKGAALRGS